MSHANADGPTSDASRYERGAAIQDRLDPDIRRDLEAGLADLAPDFARLTVEFAFGDVYARPGLDLRAREIATIAALTVLGGCEGQLAIHARFARNLGMTREEVVEIAIQMAIYGGWPRALNALRVIREAFVGEDV
jgi:4-carboxymuconolactone decarboxylase